MPLVERYDDWANCTDEGSFDNPRTLAFDHRVEAEAVGPGDNMIEYGLARLENNIKATCLITTFDPAHGWMDAGNGEWIYDPDAPEIDSKPTLGANFEWNLDRCVQHDQFNIEDTLTRNPNAASNVEDLDVKTVIATMRWPGHFRPPERLSFTSRFPPKDQYIAGSEHCSGYHLGNGLVATAGHCLQSTRSRLKMVFGWSDDVRNKRFRSSEVFQVEKILLCNSSRKYKDPNNKDEIGTWAREWDHAVVKLDGDLEQFQGLGKVELASLPPHFGSAVYNIGCPLGTPLKISPDGHVLRHATFNGDPSPFSHAIGPQSTFSTDLDQFPGNSGGPVFDARTGQVIGHTSVTKDAVSESTLEDIKAWERKYLRKTENYKAVNKIINPHLARLKPDDPGFRLHSKHYRTLSGQPSGGSLFENTTFICPGDIGPNEAKQPSGTTHAVFNRHKWDSLDVVFSNLTARIDKVYIFTSPLRKIADEFAACSLTVTIVGDAETFTKPDPRSTIIINIKDNSWLIPCTNPHTSPHHSTSQPQALTQIQHSYTATLSALLNQPHPHPPYATLASITHLRLSQPQPLTTPNPPSKIILSATFQRAAFAFPVDKEWPPGRADITHNAADEGLTWPAEEFCFVTEIGESELPMQRSEGEDGDGDGATGAVRSWAEEGRYVWEGCVDRIWT